MLYAKIDGEGVVLEFPYHIDPLGDVPADAVVVDTETNKPQISWRQALQYDTLDESYILSYIVTERFENDTQALENLKIRVRQALKNNKQRFEGLADQLVEYYPEREISSWSQQVREAELYLADNLASVPLLTHIATIRNMPMSELADKVMLKADLFSDAYGQILGEYQRVLDVLESIDFEDPLTWDNFDSLGG